MTVFFALFAAACFLFAGEELSWGQHFFGWETPASWAAHNLQEETNLHNSFIWFTSTVPDVSEIIAIVMVLYVAGPLLLLKIKLDPQKWLY